MKHRRNLAVSFVASLALHGIAVMCVAGFVIAGGVQLVPVFRQGASGIMVTLAESGPSEVPAQESIPVAEKEEVLPIVAKQMEMPVFDIREKPVPSVEKLKAPRPIVVKKAEIEERSAEEKVSGTENVKDNGDHPDSRQSADAEKAPDAGAMEVDNSKKGIQASVEAGNLLDIHPAYPLGAKLRGEEGLVVVKAMINIKGRAEKVEVLKSSGYSSLDESAVNAMKRARFVARNGGSVREGEITQPFVYKLVLEGVN